MAVLERTATVIIRNGFHMKITATNKATGEVIELDASTPEQIVQAWQTAQQYSKAADALKDQLKKLVPDLVGSRGISEPIGNCQFRITSVQRMTYDKSVMREVLDADTFDLMLKPDKTAIDRFLKENLEILGDASTALRTSMIAEGNPYQIIKLEVLS
jgi:hypothetical protein